MDIAIIAGSANASLAEATARELGTPLTPCVSERFPDTELHVSVQGRVRGAGVYLFQPTSPAVDAHLLELLLLADACRRAGAARLTAVIPYFGYARADRRTHDREGEAVSARLVADLLATAGLQRVVAVDLHNAALEGFFSQPLVHLTAAPRLIEALRPRLPKRCIVVSPDLGGVRLAERYAQALGLPLAILHKTRLSPTKVKVGDIIGDVRGHVPLIVDDMISTGGTIAEACSALSLAGAGQITVAATHALLVDGAPEQLGGLPIAQFVVSDSVRVSPDRLPHLAVVSLASLLAEAIRRLHAEEALAELVARG